MTRYVLNVETLGKNAKKKWAVATQRHLLIKGKMGALAKY